MEILCLAGTDKRMYELVAPLIMNPAIIRQNNNYPFKTTDKYLWYIALTEGIVEGFIPLKPTLSGYNIDNYYIRQDEDVTLDELLKRIIDKHGESQSISALVHKRHTSAFLRNGFSIWLEMKNYNKMDCKIHKNKE